jgi:hypothetical protein
MKRKETLFVVLVFQIVNVFCKSDVCRMKTYVSQQDDGVSQVIFEFDKHPKIERTETRKNEEVRFSFPKVFLGKRESREAENKIKSISLVNHTSVISDSKGTCVIIGFKRNSVIPIVTEQEDDPSSLTIDVFAKGFLERLKREKTITYRTVSNSFEESFDLDKKGLGIKKKIFNIEIA